MNLIALHCIAFTVAISPKSKNANEFMQEDKDLFTYLKDGKRLCQLISCLTRKQVRGMKYRTEIGSSQEEINVKQFIEHVYLNVGLKNIFEEKGEEVFKSFSNFPKVLNGLSKLAIALDTNYNINRSKGTKAAENTRIATSKEKEEPCDRILTESQSWNGFAPVFDFNQDTPPCSTDCPLPPADLQDHTLVSAFQDLLSLHHFFLKHSFETIAEELVKKDLLEAEDGLDQEIDRLIQTYRAIDREFELVETSYATVQNIYKKFKYNFRQSVNNPKTKKTIYNISQLSQTKSLSPKITKKISRLNLNDLISLIPRETVEKYYLGEQEDTCHPIELRQQENDEAPSEQVREDTILSQAYYVGKMSAEECGAVLKDEEQGTFIVRENEEKNFRISVKSFEKILHFKIKSAQTVQAPQRIIQFLEEQSQINFPLRPLDKKESVTAPREKKNYSGYENRRFSEPIGAESERRDRSDSDTIRAENYYFGPLRRNDTQMLLEMLEPGTFLIRKGKTNNMIISIKEKEKVIHLKVQSNENGEYCLQRGEEEECFESIKVMIDSLKEEDELFSAPLKAPPDELQSTLNFLVRKKQHDEFTIIYRNQFNQIKHTEIKRSNSNNFCVQGVSQDDECFESIQDIVKLLEKGDNLPSSQFNSERPSSAPAALNKETRNRFDGGRNLSIDRVTETDSLSPIVEMDEMNVRNVFLPQPKFPCFGEMTHNEATMKLFDEVEGSWLLRKNEKKELRISIKREQRILQYKLYRSEAAGGHFSIQPEFPKIPLQDLLIALQIEGFLGAQLKPTGAYCASKGCEDCA